MFDTRDAAWFKLSQKSAITGITCDEDGVFVGSVPLLKRIRDNCGHATWVPRLIAELNLELGNCYGLPIDFRTKLGRLQVIANALNQGQIALAQIATLQLHLPDCPPLVKGAHARANITELAIQLWLAGVLKAAWNPADHPRWLAGDPEEHGGEFRPRDEDAGSDIAALDRYAICNERCYPLLERRKAYGWSDKNKYDYHKCISDCMREAS